LLTLTLSGTLHLFVVPKNINTDIEIFNRVKELKPSAPQGSELIEAEREKSNISVEKLSNFLFTKDVLERQKRILSILQSEPAFDKSQNYFNGRTEAFKTALGRAKRMRQLEVEHKWDQNDLSTAYDLISEPGPYGLHIGMYLVSKRAHCFWLSSLIIFQTTLRGQGTPEQQKLFLEPAENYKHIGCYAQTELGHGSNVRGLETTATYNPENKSFTLHSPALTASKWWIGSLGRTANHAVVMAQLIIAGKPYGPHPFICQIRDLKTHEPLEGIHVGDIGPKFGYNTMDNGFLLLNHVKIPHINMLARFSRVDPKTNKYVKPSSASLVYGTLTWVRSTIVLQSGGVLARGVTIATRYASVRRQFQDRDAPSDTDGENQVLNYTMVQFRLLPLLAATFALHFTGKAMMKLYQQNQKKMESYSRNGSDANRGAGPEETHSGSDLLADLHATSCGL
jgi:acyl-CoA oxidase